MENPRPEKVATVAEITAKFKAADGAILTEYRGMSVGAMAALRKQLRAAGTEWKVYKNTYARRAAADAGLGALAEQLTGPTAVAFVTGDVAAAAASATQHRRRASEELSLLALTWVMPVRKPLPPGPVTWTGVVELVVVLSDRKSVV